MSRRPIWFQLTPDLESALVQEARRRRLAPRQLLEIAVREHLEWEHEAGYLYLHQLQIPLRVVQSRGPTEPLPDRLVIGPNPFTVETWRRLRDEQGARLYLSIPGLRERLGIEE